MRLRDLLVRFGLSEARARSVEERIFPLPPVLVRLLFRASGLLLVITPHLLNAAADAIDFMQQPNVNDTSWSDTSATEMLTAVFDGDSPFDSLETVQAPIAEEARPTRRRPNALAEMEDRTCSICTENVEDGERRLLCGHIFHRHCVDTWFSRQRASGQQKSCPTCRASVVRVPQARAGDVYGAHLLPRFIFCSIEQLEEFHSFDRPPSLQWQSLHLAAMAGRTDVLKYLHKEKHLSILLKDRSGRNILHAAISHRRYHVVDWLINDVADNLIDYHGRKQLFQMVDPKRGLPPFLAAATDLDYDLLVAFIREPGYSERGIMGRLPTGCEPEMVEKAMNLIAQVKQQQLLRPLLPPYRGTAEECLELLLQRLRENDLGADDRLFNWYDDENVGDVARTKELLSECIWFKMHQQPEGTNTIAEALTLIREWKPWNQNELFNMYQTLQKAVEGGHLEMVEWLLDTWGVDPSPPSNYRWSGEDSAITRLGRGSSTSLRVRSAKTRRRRKEW